MRKHVDNEKKLSLQICTRGKYSLGNQRECTYSLRYETYHKVVLGKSGNRSFSLGPRSSEVGSVLGLKQRNIHANFSTKHRLRACTCKRCYAFSHAGFSSGLPGKCADAIVILSIRHVMCHSTMVHIGLLCNMIIRRGPESRMFRWEKQAANHGFVSV